MILTELRGYQREAVEKALPHDGFCLIPEQRTGKTLTTLAIVDVRKPDILFVICPKKAVRVWKTEIKKSIKFDWSCKRMVVHYEAMTRNPKDRAYYRRMFRGWHDEGLSVMIVVDEAHRTKRRGSLASRMVRSIGKYANYRLALTGTPIAQGIHDVWAIFNFIRPGAFGSWDAFAERHIRMGGFKGKKIVGYRNTKRFYKIFHRYSYRITLREAQIAEGQKPYQIRRRKIYFDLSPESRRVYEDLQTKLEAEVRKKKISTPLVMTLVFKLQQVAGGYAIQSDPIYRKDGLPALTKSGKPKVRKSIIPIGREKMVVLARTLVPLRKKKVVICANYRHELDAIGELLTSVGRTWKMIAGGIPFDGEFDTDVILLQIRSGEAIDLAEADTYIFYSWNHSYINYEQARFRILKFGSRLVNYIYLIAKDTVDIDIYDAVMGKKDLADLVCDKYRKRRRGHESVRSNGSNQTRASKAAARA